MIASSIWRAVEEEANVSSKWLLFFSLVLWCLVFWVSINYNLVIVWSNAFVKQEKEIFSIGPLSVLMMSVTNNTQVCRFQLLRYQFYLTIWSPLSTVCPSLHLHLFFLPSAQMSVFLSCSCVS